MLNKKNIFIALSVVSLLIYFTVFNGRSIECSEIRESTYGVCVVLNKEHHDDYMLGSTRMYVPFKNKKLMFYGYSVVWDNRMFSPLGSDGYSMSSLTWPKLSAVLSHPTVLVRRETSEMYFQIANSEYPIRMACRILPPKSTACKILLDVGHSYFVTFDGLSVNEPVDFDEILAELVKFQKDFEHPFEYFLVF
ncbi:MAG TPA: hypothetical protein DCS87_00050 [Rheinheimera sp.]|nr:hypothetical protein [Rheinheimera sp.]